MTQIQDQSNESATDWRDRIRRTRTRTRVLTAVIAVVLVAGIVVGAVLWRISADYQALNTAGWYGPRPDRPGHVVWTRFGDAHRLLGPAGARQEFEFALVDEGSHPLTVTAIDLPTWNGPGQDPISAVAWAPYHGIPGGLINGRPSSSRPFPANVAAHGIVKIRFTVTKPACPAPGGPDLDVTMRVHWHAMISSHVTVVEPGGEQYHVVVCG